MPIIDHVQETYVSAVIQKCEESGCKLTIDIKPRKVICKGELLLELIWGNQVKMTDGIIFICNTHFNIVSVELKGKTVKASDISEKFTNSIKLIYQILADGPKMAKAYKIHLIVVAKRWDRQTQISITNNIRGKMLSDPIFGKCGDSLSNIFKKYDIPY
jgi:hypothetical protein